MHQVVDNGISIKWADYGFAGHERMLLAWHRRLHFSTPFPWHAMLVLVAALCTDPMS